MAPAPILIAALSARALAQSARRAGFAPLVVDGFGDEDMREAAMACRVLPQVLTRGFTAPPLLAAFEELARNSPSLPIGAVLGSGFERAPGAAAATECRYRVLGNGANALRSVADPERFFPLLEDAGVRCPETRLAPDPNGIWLKKRVGGGGGQHIRWSKPGDGPSRDYHFQRYVEGLAISALAIASPNGWSLKGLSRQWTSPVPQTPFRYGGAVGPVDIPRVLIERTSAMMKRLENVIDLTGLISLDFIVHGDRAWLLEINPRPGATLDIFDDEEGSLFSAHVEACLQSSQFSTTLSPPAPSFPRRREPSSPMISRSFKCSPRASPMAINDLGSRLRGNDAAGGSAVPEISGRGARNRARAAAYLYAGHGVLRVPAIDWPPWAADRPAPGTIIRRHHPVATVFADGRTDVEAEALCRERLGLLAEMLYGRANREGARE